jgi:hypothetical protein
MPEETPLLDGAGLAPHLFVVRIWYEPSRRAGKQWRGSVEHVPSGQRLYFASLGDLTDFITLRLNGKPATDK